jgi:CheY-like chemotaxis protein
LLIALDGTILGSNALARSAFGLSDGDGCKKFNELPKHVREPLHGAVEAAFRGGTEATVVEALTSNPGASLRIVVGAVRDGPGAVTAVLAMGRRPEPETAGVRTELQKLDRQLRDTDERLRRQLEELERGPAGQRSQEPVHGHARPRAAQSARRGRERPADHPAAGRKRSPGPAGGSARRAPGRPHRRLLDDLLDVSRIVLGKIQLRGEPVDLRDVVRRVASAARFGVQSQLLVLKIELPGEPLVVHGDPTRLEQCVGNLLGNAAKYTPRGGTIVLSAHVEAGSAVIRVRDSGIGIAPEMLDQIFDLFTQADTSLARARGGLGIGLTLARRLVELHGGVLTARSEGLGQGSEFEIRLPAHDLAGPLPPPAPPPVPVVRRRVLVVDDNRDARETLRTVLSMNGHTVTDAGDGASAIRLAVEWAPDVALIDIGLPEMDGYEVARRIRARVGTLVRLVALTGYSDAETRRRVTEAGFQAHLVKPAAPDEIERLLAAR